MKYTFIIKKKLTLEWQSLQNLLFSLIGNCKLTIFIIIVVVIRLSVEALKVRLHYKIFILENDIKILII